MTAEEHNTLNRKLDELLARTQALEAKCATLEARVNATRSDVVRLVPGMVNTASVPVLRANGAIEALPPGYDIETGVFTLSPIYEGTEVEASGIKGREGFCQSSEEDSGGLPGHGALKGFFHVLFPLWLLAQVHGGGSGMKQDGFPVSLVAENVQGAINQTRVGLHGPDAKGGSALSQSNSPAS